MKSKLSFRFCMNGFSIMIDQLGLVQLTNRKTACKQTTVAGPNEIEVGQSIAYFGKTILWLSFWVQREGYKINILKYA